MLKNYLITIFRNIKTHKLPAVISIVGLAVGMTCCLLIMSYVSAETSYDKYNHNAGNIYRAVAGKKALSGKVNDPITPPALAPALMNGVKEISAYVRLMTFDNPSPLLSYGGKKFYEKGLCFADENLLNMFSFRCIKGEPDGALQEPNSAVISESSAERYFGSENPIGKVLRLNNSLDLKVTGVIRDIPLNSSVKKDIFISFHTLNSWLGKEFTESWQNSMCETYVMFKEGVIPSDIEGRMSEFVAKNIGGNNSIKEIRFQPLNRIHLYSKEDYGISSGGDIKTIYLLTGIAFFVMLIAFFNYMNLRTSQVLKRKKEIGIRKAVGATTGQLSIQLLIEGMVYILLAFLITLSAVQVIAPYAADYAGIRFVGNWEILAKAAIPVLIAAIIVGSIPVFFLRGINTDGKAKSYHKLMGMELSTGKVVVITQFALTNFLIAGSLVIISQLDYMRGKDLGFAGDQVLVTPVRNENLRKDQSALINKLRYAEGIKDISASALLPGGPVGKTQVRLEGRAEEEMMSMLWVGNNFNRTLGAKMTAGRDFSPDYYTDASEGFIINEEAVKKLGFHNPDEVLNKSFEISGGKKGKIIGIVKDFHYASMQNKINPLVMHIWPWLNYLLVRFDAGHTYAVIDKLKAVMNETEPEYPFEYKFLNDNFSRYYEKENALKKSASFFSLIALVLAGFGLFGLSANALERRTKEITIRKVLGASQLRIFFQQIKEFALIMIISLVIACPASYLIMNGWLNDYAYHAEIGINIYAAVLIISFMSLIFISGYHAVKAAKSNPINGLRYE